MSFDWTPEELQEVVEENQIVIFMKGTPEQPQCGFSARGAQVLSAVIAELGMETFACVNVLLDPRARSALKEWSDFPTIPQVFINGELIGGSDIVLEMYESGDLKKMLSNGGNASE
ncbi:MAG TPA: Grx4 family monothiol glutaredoxin [Candidatus Poseidoniales archaeon]|jgi:monothiol glutaredoxin|nr:MAG: monothiol glutaredoxin, Grx4 family [Euryarchaeota archaeon]HIG33903.1 Grx4 family monothiol glutaredoxin [Candidatus Poseidoniales archaeon]HIL67567.1 Grx4 family monothiol glutaredoxin [Candidatus Poseidoniales archaeon]